MLAHTDSFWFYLPLSKDQTDADCLWQSSHFAVLLCQVMSHDGQSSSAWSRFVRLPTSLGLAKTSVVFQVSSIKINCVGLMSIHRLCFSVFTCISVGAACSIRINFCCLKVTTKSVSLHKAK